MNWEAVIAISAATLGVAGGANYWMLNAIKIAILQQTATLKEWATAEFATQKETERRLSALEHRR